MSSEREPTVIVRNAYKRYTPNAVILNGLNMTVPEGHIYGLLGPSGCGKTSLLSCIVGTRTFDSGSISLSVSRKVELGYMPQEISLNTEFTITEVFYFYGRLYNLSNERIEYRSNELVKFLELPPLDRMVGNCSGGQQRRVSMAVTLLHDPKLLILDEPTVGVDPILSHSIWEHFMALVNERGKTIIITTHYIEEARAANTIALMRGGVLLAEQPPDVLIQKYNVDSLEQVFLKLSEKQENIQDNIKPYPSIERNIPPFYHDKAFNIGRFKAQLVKNFNWTRRNLPVTAFVICLPAILFAILNEMTSKEAGDFPITPKPLAFVNQETSCRNKNEYIKLGSTCSMSRPLSCRYLANCEDIFTFDEYHNVEEGIKAVRDNRARAVLVFEANFSQYLMERVVEQTSATKKALNDSQIKVWMDKSEFGSAVRTERELAKRIIETVQEVCVECGYNPRMAAIPIYVHDPVFNSRDVMQSALAPYYSSIGFYTAMMYTSSAIVMERASGLFERSEVAGLTFSELVAAHVVMQVVVAILQNILSFLVLYVLFANPMHGSYILAFFVMFLIDMSGMVFGFLLAVFIQIEKNVAYAGVVTVLTLFMLTGTLWPVEALHWSMVPFSKGLPTTIPSKSFYNISLRGMGIGDTGVYTGILTSLGFSTAFTVISILSVRFKIASFAN